MNEPKRTIVAAAVCLLFLYGCKGSGGSAGTAPTAAPGRATALYASGAVVPGRIVSLPATASGLVAPVTSIQSTQTANFGESYSMAYDPNANQFWVTSCLLLSRTNGPVLAFNAGANGSSVSPAIAIAGSATGLSGCQLGIAIDTSGNVYVADHSNAPPQYPGGQVAIFDSSQTGNVAPVARIAGTAANFHSPAGVALDASGNLYVADTGQGFSGYAGDVEVFGSGANGNVSPTRIISGSSTGLNSPFGLAFDRFGDLYVTNPPSNSITVFAPAANGNATPLRTISGSSTLLSAPTGIAVDSAGYVYVGNENQTVQNAPILVFGPGASGNVAPVQSITVNASRFTEPSGIAIR